MYFGQQIHSAKPQSIGNVVIIACIARPQIQRKHAKSIPSLESYKLEDKYP